MGVGPAMERGASASARAGVHGRGIARATTLDEPASASLRGRVHARDRRPLRVAVIGETGVREAPVVAGRWRIEGLCAGSYRVELIGARVVVSRRVELGRGQRAAVDFVVW